MKTDISPAAQLAVLLMARWSVNEAKPLTNSEFSEVRRNLGSPQVGASSVLEDPGSFLVQGLDPERLSALLGRGLGVFHQLDRWMQAGIWVVSWADPHYPERFKQLKNRAPMLLFGCGDPQAFNGKALACVGSRNASTERLNLAARVGRACSEADIVLVSGGAKGVDSCSMSAAIVDKGRSVGVLSDSLLKESMKKPYREALHDGRLCLMSEVHPEARFEVGNAMARNRLAYACADAALVVECEPNKGGTWAGALDALKEGKVVYVIKGALAEKELAAKGAIAVTEDFACSPEKLIHRERPTVTGDDLLKRNLRDSLGDEISDLLDLTDKIRQQPELIAGILFQSLYAPVESENKASKRPAPESKSLFDDLN